MDTLRIDDLARLLGRTSGRRRLVLGLAVGAVGLTARGPGEVAARKRRKEKVRRNAFGCVDVGGFCKNAGQCCSGICEGKKGKQKCRAHDGGTGCRAGLVEDGCGGAVDVECTTSTGQTGICNTTTGNAGYCIGIGGVSPTPGCTKDADCRALCGADAAVCIVCEGAGFCTGPSAGDCNP